MEVTMSASTVRVSRAHAGRMRLLLLVCGIAVFASAAGAGSAQAAGGTWTKSTPGFGKYYMGVDFVDNLNGWLVGEEQIILRTTDGGASWTQQHLSPGAYGLYAVQMWSATRGWAVGNGGALFATTDGTNWTPQSAPPGSYLGPMEDLCFVSGNEGWAVGSSSHIIHTTTAGVGWAEANTGVPEGVDSIWFNGVDFVDSMHGWAVGEDYHDSKFWASVYATSNGGANWSFQWPARTFMEGELNDVEFFPPSGLWVCGEDATQPFDQRGMIWHNTGGPAWTRQVLPSGVDTLNAIHFVSATDGWAVGDDVILVTTNGGGLWTVESDASTYNGILTDIDSFDGVTAWASGFGDRVMIRGTDGAAPVTVDNASGRWTNRAVTVKLTATDVGSGVARTEYQIDWGAAKEGASVSFAAPQTHAGDGDHVLSYWSTDRAGNVEAAKTCHVRIDTRKPRTLAPNPVSVRRYATVALKYGVVDATPNGGTAAVSIKILNGRGAVVKTLALGAKPVNAVASAWFRCSLPKGTYRYYVYATDKAGNPQTIVGNNKLTVR